MPQNRYALCGFYFVYLDRKSGAEIFSPTPLYCFFYFCMLFYFSAPLGRLTPIEALPQAPLGALPPDPHNGFHPLTLTRGVPLDLLLASLGVDFYFMLVIYSVWLCHSSLLTPHFNREVYPRSYPASHPRLPLSHHYRKLSQTSGL